MLKYQTINEANQVQDRLRRNHYGRNLWRSDTHTRDGDTLSLFTLSPEAERDSKANFDLVMATARHYGQTLLCIKPTQIQVAGTGDSGRTQAVADALFPKDWIKSYEEWIDSSHGGRPRLEQSLLGEVCEFYTYRPAFCLRGQQGVYDVATGRRLTNRREIIERMWDLGFAAQRGRPLSIARIRWTGQRDELEEISELADRYWNRRYTSEAAKKLVSAWRSINRYAAWPGSW